MKGMEENDDELSDVDKEESSLEENSESECEVGIHELMSDVYSAQQSITCKQ